jgi:hypothetical protein
MAADKIIQNMILQLGQSQDDRTAEELGIHFADVDGRTSYDLLLAAMDFARFVNFYANNTSTSRSDWSTFFPDNETKAKALLAKKDGSVTPHLGLFLSFLELYKTPQGVLNEFTGRHLDFYYQDVLGLTKKSAVADKAHVLLELKKNSSAISISPDNTFSAGKPFGGQSEMGRLRLCRFADSGCRFCHCRARFAHGGGDANGHGYANPRRGRSYHTIERDELDRRV